MKKRRKISEEGLRRLRESIQRTQPWKTGGVKTQEGKAKTRLNAQKHGLYGAELAAMRALLRAAKTQLKQLGVTRNSR